MEQPVVVVGGGVMGMASALRLLETGFTDVTLVAEKLSGEWYVPSVCKQGPALVACCVSCLHHYISSARVDNGCSSCSKRRHSLWTTPRHNQQVFSCSISTRLAGRHSIGAGRCMGPRHTGTPYRNLSCGRQRSRDRDHYSSGDLPQRGRRWRSACIGADHGRVSTHDQN